MTIKQLTAILKDYNQELEVYIDVGDCMAASKLGSVLKYTVDSSEKGVVEIMLVPAIYDIAEVDNDS